MFLVIIWAFVDKFENQLTLDKNYSKIGAFHILYMGLIPKDPTSRKYMLMGFRIVGDFGATIAIPVILFVFIAQKLEAKYGGAPWFTVIAFILSGLLTGYIINKKAKEYGREYHKLNEDKKQEVEKINQPKT